MFELQRPYKIDIGTAQCTSCGAGIRKYYMGLDSPHPVCSKCVNKVFRVKVSKEELAVPIALIERANNYVLHRLFLAQHQSTPIDIELNFLGAFTHPNYTPYFIKVINDKFYADDKELKPAWVEALHHHLRQKYQEIKLDEEKQNRKLLVCKVCKKPLYHNGAVASKKGSYRQYRCLSGKDCPVSSDDIKYAHYGGNEITLIRN